LTFNQEVRHQPLIRQAGKKLDARAQARLARTRVDHARAERNTKIEATLAEFFTAGENASRIVCVLGSLLGSANLARPRDTSISTGGTGETPLEAR
jgi:hypothetical protein